MAENKRTEIENYDRSKVIVRTSIIGIAANILLAGAKAVIGFFSGSIAVVLDAVNNLSDALSSVITIIGTKLASKSPDKKHPLGYGRIEYLTAAIVAAVVLYAGITSLVESAEKIINPEKANYSLVSLIIIGLAVAVKFFLGKYVKSQGKKVNSGSLIASGSDALFDSILSASVLACAVFFILTDISLEAYAGLIISAVIIKSGIEMMSDTVNEILGKRADAEQVREIKDILTSFDNVRGAYDLIINNYGPNKNYASVHLELPDSMTVEQVDKLTRKAEAAVYVKTGTVLTAVGVYSYNTEGTEGAVMRNAVMEKVMSHDFALQMHGFFADVDEKIIRFDVVLSFDADPKEATEILTEQVREMYPGFKVSITPDVDLSDI